MDDDDLSDDEQTTQVGGVLVKALGVLVVIGVLIFVGTTIMVRALDLDEDTGTGPVGSQAEPNAPLPTTALPDPDDESEDPSEEPSESPSASPSDGPKGRIELAVSPVIARGDRPGRHLRDLHHDRPHGREPVPRLRPRDPAGQQRDPGDDRLGRAAPPAQSGM
jgi:hypothetical protein